MLYAVRVKRKFIKRYSFLRIFCKQISNRSLYYCKKMVDDFQWKWYKDLDDIVRCPVCLEKPGGTIEMCSGGHHLCASCRSMLAVCPVCKKAFSSCRNYLAEHVIEKIKEIKSLHVNGNHEKSETSKKLSVGVQTEPLKGAIPKLRSVAGPIVSSENDDDKSSLKSGSVHTSEPYYHCRVGDCSAQVTRPKMLAHINQFHKMHLYQMTAEEVGDEFVCDYTWPAAIYEIPLSITYVLNVKKMGIFFLKLVADRMGFLKGYLQSINNSFFSQDFTYKLELETGQRSFKYEGQANSCRFSTGEIYSYLHVDPFEMKYILKRKDITRCNITIRCKAQKCLRPSGAGNSRKMRNARVSPLPSQMHNASGLNRNSTAYKRGVNQMSGDGEWDEYIKSDFFFAF